jgi:hypothetical protein
MGSPLLALFLLLSVLSAGATAGTYTEDFTTTTYRDGTGTTALWDTGAGELSLPDFDLTLEGSYNSPGVAQGVAVAGDYAYVADGLSGLRVVDISDPANPVSAGVHAVADFAYDVDVAGDHAYVADRFSGLRVVDISDPTNPTLAGTFATPDLSLEVAVAGNYAYVADRFSGLVVVNISDPTNPTSAGSYNTPGEAVGVAVEGNYAYVGDAASGLYVIDISTPTSPSLAGTYDTPGEALGIAIAGNYAYVADRFSGLRVVDISNPSSPTSAGVYDTPDYARAVAVSGDYACVADGESGLVMLDISDPTTPTLVDSYDTDDWAASVVVEGEHAYLADNDTGLLVFRVALPVSPPLLAGGYDTASFARGVDVAGNHAYVADYYSGLQVIDISDPENPASSGSYDSPGYAWGVVVSGDYAYVADMGGGLRVVDVSVPSSPTSAGVYDTPGNAHRVVVDGDYAYVADGPSGLRVVDISTPSTPASVGVYDSPGDARGVAIAGDYAYVADYDAGLRVVDVSDPSNPVSAGSYDTSGWAQGVATAGDCAYVADDASGLQVIDISDPTNPTLLGTYNTTHVALDVVVEGDLAYVSDKAAGVHVIDVSNPAAPAFVGSYDTSGNAMGIVVAGDHVYVADDGSGLHALEVYQRLYETASDAGLSLSIATPLREFARARLTASHTDDFLWELSPDSGSSWETVPSTGTWHDFTATGTDLLWRSTLKYPGGGTNPTCTDLEIEWELVPLDPGDLVITEIMKNPAAVADANGEWFEIYNASGGEINLSGLEIKDDGTDSHTIPSDVLVAAGDYALLAINDDSGTNGGLPPVDYEYSGFTLDDTEDEIVLMSGAVEVDRVAYGGRTGFPDPTGASMYLIDVVLDNNVGSNWAEDTWHVYGDGDFGTPGVANEHDDIAPSSSVDIPPDWWVESFFDVSYSADDGAGSGVASVELFYQIDGGGYLSYGTFTSSPVEDFPTGVDGVYDFYTVATDNAGNVEDPPGTPDGTMTVDTQPPTGTFNINGGDEYTSSPDVTLYLDFSDENGVADARFRNEGEAWIPWEPYVPTRPWTLSPDDGAKAVEVTLRDQAGNMSSPSIGHITLDTEPPSVSGIIIKNETLLHTDDFAKDGDDLELRADVTDNLTPLTAADIVADLSDLLDGGGTAVEAESYDGATATWILALADVFLGPDGARTAEVIATDGAGTPASGTDDIIADNTLPLAVGGLWAEPGHETIDLEWSDVSGLDAYISGVDIRYDRWNDYPDYQIGAPSYPSTHLDGLDSWIAWGGTSMAQPTSGDRAIYYMTAFGFDEARNYGPASPGAQARATNYWLGDVAAGMGDWGADVGYTGYVDDADIDKLGGMYGAPPAGYFLECDVAPTHDMTRIGIPEPDDMIDFEDAMIFAMNYGVAAARIIPFLPEVSTKGLALRLTGRGELDDGEFEVALVLAGNAGRVKGISAGIEFDPGELEFLSARLSDHMLLPLAELFFWHGGNEGSVQVDLAVLGTDVTIGGAGEVAILRFRALGDGYGLDFGDATLRNAGNEDLVAELEGCESSPMAPTAFALKQNVPNPFNPTTTIGYDVPQASHVSIRVYDVAGRLVRTLVDESAEPGRHEAVWGGRNDRGETVGSGVYFCVMAAGEYRASRKMLLLK